MTLTTSGSRSTAARSRTRPATTSRPARAEENRPAAGGAPAPKRWASSPGQRVEREPYDLLFGERKAPDGTQLGRPPGSGRKAADLYAALLAAEPHATAERRRELRIEAIRQARQSPLFFDLTVSLSKSISIFHASLGENARLARQAGDHDGDAYWSALVGEVDDMIWQAVHAGFGYFQREAGYTRTGSHGTRVHGRETGQWHEADLAVAHWLQHTSRDGDMQLHVHSQIAHVAKTATDGKWRAPDSLGYNEHIGAVAAIVSQHLEEALTARFGLEWAARDDGHGFEIKGISGEMMRVFSSRRASITADLRARAARFEQRYGRAPSQRELAHLAQASNFNTRAAKHGALDLAQLHAGWADKLARTLGVSLASVAPSVWHGAAAARARTRAARTTRRCRPSSSWPARRRRRSRWPSRKSTWTRADVIKYLGRVLPRSGMDPARSSSRAAAAAGSRPERGRTRPRYLITSARVQVLFSCWASALASSVPRGPARVRREPERVSPVARVRVCASAVAMPDRWRDRRQAHAEGTRELIRPARVQLREIQRALFRSACFEVGRLRELRELALRWRAAVPLLEPRRAGAQVRGDRCAARGEHAHHVATDALDLEPVTVIPRGPFQAEPMG